MKHDTDTETLAERFAGAGLAVLVVLVVACGGTGTNADKPAEVTVSPPSTVAETTHMTTTTAPAPETELTGACHGKPVAWAAPYAGEVHPLVIAGPWGRAGDWDWLPPNFDVNRKWADGEWASPMIQLIVCPESAKPEPGGSCGTYTRDDGVRGELIRFRDVVKIRVVVARTGETLQSTTLLGPKTECPASTGIGVGVAPPWSFLGEEVTFDQIEEYATAVSKQSVE